MGNWWESPIWQGFKWTPTNTAAHSGIDLGMPIGTPLTALYPGQVISAAVKPWGGQVNLLHDWPSTGRIVVSYLHGSALKCTAGQNVEPGDVVMLSGEPPSPTYGTGAHCHFEATVGDVPPYMGYNPRSPTPTSHPIDPTFLLDYAKQTDGGVQHMGVPQGWRDDGQTLVASNGVQVIHGIREYILGRTWDPGNVPHAIEYYPQVVSPAHPEWGDGARQDFRDGSVLWLKQHQDRGVFAAETGFDYVAVSAQLVLAQQQIVALEAQLGANADPGYVQYKAAAQAIADALKTLTANG